MLRYVFLFVISLAILVPVSPQDVDLADELETILILVDSGLTKIEIGLEKSETAILKLEEGQTILEKQQSDFARLLKSYERRIKLISYAFFGVTLLFAIETIAFSVVLNSPIYVNH